MAYIRILREYIDVNTGLVVPTRHDEDNDSLKLKQIHLVDPNSPIIVESDVLIPNLNAEKLNGLTFDQFVTVDGSNPIIGDLDLNGHRIINLDLAQDAGDAVSKRMLDDLNDSIRIRPSVSYVADSHIDLVNLPSPLIIDGQQVQDFERVLLTTQNNPVENGIYIYTSGVLQRSDDFYTGMNCPFGMIVAVQKGDRYYRSIFINTQNQTNLIVDTDPLFFERIRAGIEFITGDGLSLGTDPNDPTQSILNLVLADLSLSLDQSGLKVADDGIGVSQIDFAPEGVTPVNNQVSAIHIPVEDANAKYTTANKNVENILLEIANRLETQALTVDDLLMTIYDFKLAGEPINTLDVVTLGLDGRVYKADPNDVNKIDILGVAVEGGQINNGIKIKLIGKVTGFAFDSSMFNKPVYLDPANPGKLTIIEPTIPGVYKYKIGRVIDTVSIVIEKQFPILLS